MIYRKQLDCIFSPTGWLDESSLLLWLPALTKLNSICFSFSSQHLSLAGSCQVKERAGVMLLGGSWPSVQLPGSPSRQFNFQSTFFKVKLPTGSGSSPTEISNSAQERELYTTIAVQILCLEFNSIDYLLSRVWRPSLTLLNSLTSKYISTIQYSNYLYTQCFTNLEHYKFRYEKCPVILYHFYLHWIRKLNQDNSSRYRASFNQDNGYMLKGYVKRIIFLTIKSILVP